jgi:hypothetical protein
MIEYLDTVKSNLEDSCKVSADKQSRFPRVALGGAHRYCGKNKTGCDPGNYEDMLLEAICLR